MTLEEIRKNIDRVDLEIKKLFLERMDIATQVAKSKNDAGSSDVYRADREQHIIDTLTADVDPKIVAEYSAFIRKTIEVSRMYEYGLLCDWNPSYTEELIRPVNGKETDRHVKVRLTRPDVCNAMSSILSMIGDYGYNMQQMVLLENDSTAGTVTFELTILGNLLDPEMQKLMFQLYKETKDFRILESY